MNGAASLLVAAATSVPAARPKAPPSCLPVFISPDAAPACSGATPVVTIVARGALTSPPATGTDEQRQCQHREQKRGVGRERLAELLTATLDRLAANSVERWQARAPGRPHRGSAATAIRAFIAEALPTDEESRAFHRVGVSLEVLAVTGSAAAGDANRRHLGALAEHLTELLVAGGQSAADAVHLAREVLAISHGLGTLVMAGISTAEDAVVVAEGYLDGLQSRLSG